MIYPVILCGGSGTRLWPLSRKSYPKQFVPLTGAQTLFQATAQRMTGSAALPLQPPLVVTGAAFRFIAVEQLAEAGVDPGAVLIEPEPRNTGPAVLAAALHLAASDPEAVMLVAPSDHVLPDTKAFHRAVARGLAAAQAGRLVTFGITPRGPETGYGYLELTDCPGDDGAPVELKAFVEKPGRDRAEMMLTAGNFLWNAGIFLFRATDIIDAFQAHAPGLLAPVRAAVAGARPDLGFLRLAAESWAEAEDISLDYAVMERAGNLSAVPFDGDWSDLGGWDAVHRALPRDAAGVAITGGALALDCRDTLLHAEGARVQLVGLGLENIAAVAMGDAVLVADMSRAQEVKAAVHALSARGAAQATEFPKAHRPWGWFERLVTGDQFQVKRIHVHPGAALSLQSHDHRAEHWVVVEGTADVTLDGQQRRLEPNQSAYIPIGARHRLANPGDAPLVVIEVQTGSYLGEDDITRFDDAYAREPGE